MKVILNECKSFIHYYWNGKSPKLAPLFNTQEILDQNPGNEFQVILWVNQTIFDDFLSRITRNAAHTSTKKSSSTVIAQRGETKIVIANFDLIFFEERQHYKNLFSAYDLLNSKKLFAFSSDFARKIILNKYRGIYIDHDMLVNKSAFFLKNIDEIGNAPFNAPYFLYMQFREIFGGMLLPVYENQVIFSPIKNAFSEILIELDKEIDLHKMAQSITIFLKALNNEQGKIHQDPFFRASNSPLLNEYLSSKQKATELSSSIFGDEENRELNGAILYLQIFYHKISLPWENGTFSCDRIPETLASLFYNPKQDTQPVYSWTHPWFFHLSKLEQAANTLQKYFRTCRGDSASRHSTNALSSEELSPTYPHTQTPRPLSSSFRYAVKATERVIDGTEMDPRECKTPEHRTVPSGLSQYGLFTPVAFEGDGIIINSKSIIQKPSPKKSSQEASLT